MSQLPIRKLTLYKQGIGYFERQGSTEEPTITLIVPHEAINDVLKSLNVEPEEGQVLSVDYETPEDKNAILAELPVRVNNRSSLIDLLSSLRGATVTLRMEDGNSLQGRLIGVEASLDPSAQPPSVLLKDESDVQVIPLTLVNQVALHNEQVSTDVDYFLDVSQSEQQRALLTVRLSEDVQTLNISYQAPSPIWRVSYRLVSTGDQQARLIGWGLFDNTLDEDLENVALTLITGRPISFEYDLYEARVPGRPRISDDTTILESFAGHPRAAEMISALSHELRTPLSSIRGYADLLMMGASGDLTTEQKKMAQVIKRSADHMSEQLNDLFDLVRVQDDDEVRADTSFYRSGPLGDLKVSSSYFVPMMMGNAEPEYLTYTVETPVSVRRGQSAMVPIINEDVEYESLCVYNGSKMANHPLLVWRLQNTTGLALEQGPVTVIEEGRYMGEGLMRFIGVGDDIQIPYALEFGILVNVEKETGRNELWEVIFDNIAQNANVTRYQVTTYTYTLDSHCNREVEVLLERRDPNRGEYFDMPEPAMAADGHTRWAVVVPPQEQVTFTVQERVFTRAINENNIMHWESDYVEKLVEAGMLSDPVIEPLRRITDLKQQIANADHQIKTQQAEREHVIAGQEQLRQNLRTLGESEREVSIRDRILDDLEQSENRRREIENTINDLEETKRDYHGERQTLHVSLFTEET